MASQVVLHDASQRRWLRFSSPLEVIAAYRQEEVLPRLAAVEERVEQGGLYAAGYIAYEAAPAFDPALHVRSPRHGLPLLWFGIFEAPQTVELAEGQDSYELGSWRPSVGQGAYRRSIDRIKDHIAAGDTYQVNYTLRLRAPFQGDAWPFFLDLVRAQACEYGAYVDLADWVICSASPELFFARKEGEVVMRPMKGTAARGLTPDDDHRLAEWLHHSEKNRAENVMIVDMIRNDLGRVSRVGSVHVPRLFDVERYPTLWQMTSTVAADSQASLVDLMTALFPCASITGAPKVRTMAIIADLEQEPRGVYCGCIGFLAPGRQAQFNVAIRTAVIDRAAATVEFGVGGGIVWDSTTGEEYREWETKAQVLTERRPAFQLLESLLWTPEEGYVLLERHLARLISSAEYFAYPVDASLARAALAEAEPANAATPHKVRLLLDRQGALAVTSAPLGKTGAVTIGLASEPISSADRFLYHKTTYRQVYERARASRPDCDEVLLWNERGELTEASSANVVVRLQGALMTPPLSAGLLPGTMRAELLAQGRIQEATILVDQLSECDAIYLINSVRGWREARLQTRLAAVERR